MWQAKQFEELSVQDFYWIERLRLQTFVVEQDRLYNDLDDHDLTAIHVFHMTEDGRVDAYARAFDAGTHISFGRVVTVADARGQGLGRILTEKLMAVCAREWPSQTIVIHAQEQVVGFYERFGFKAISEPYILESTPHVTMEYVYK